MRQEGLVTIERNTNDKRLVNVTLTDKGREVLSRAIPVAREVADRVMLSLAEGDTGLLEKLLGILSQNAHDGLEHVAKLSRPQLD